MIKTIIFDIGEVVTTSDFKSIYTGFAQKIGVSPEFISNYHKENLDDFFVGKITLDQFWQDMKDAGGKTDIDYREVWIEEGLKYTQIDNNILNVIEKLRKNYTLATLTNLTPTRMIVDEQLDIFSHFDHAFLSCKERLAKPDPEFYKLALMKTNTEPHEAIFVDDNEIQTKGARFVGITPIVYTFRKSDELVEKLRELKVQI